MTQAPGGVLDDALLERLFVKLEKPIYNVVYRWLWNAEEAHDVTQEAFLKLWKMRDEVDVATIEPLVYRIAINLAANKRRARKLWGWLSFAPEHEPSAPDDQAGALLDRERDTRVRAAIDALPEGLRRVVVLSELSELGYEEIAAALSIPAGTVASRRHRAIKLLRERLEPLMREEASAT